MLIHVPLVHKLNRGANGAEIGTTDDWIELRKKNLSNELVSKKNDDSIRNLEDHH